MWGSNPNQQSKLGENKMIPISKPIISEAEKQAVLEVLESGMLAQGKRVARLEELFADVCGTKYAIATSSGTTALHIALLAQGIGPGDQVITTPFTTGIASEIGGTAGQWISMFNLSNIPVHVNDVIFGEPSVVTRSAPASELPAWVLVGWFFLWTLGPAGILWLRYRRLTP